MLHVYEHRDKSFWEPWDDSRNIWLQMLRLQIPAMGNEEKTVTGTDI